MNGPAHSATDAPATTGFGVYVHFPFCLRRCPYCDFNVLVAETIPHERYRDAVLAELAARAPAFAGRPPAVSLYFGGGTPGLWAPACVGAVIEAVDARLGLAAGAEITLECNPAEAEPGRLRDFRSAGVNRVSLGTQSFADETLARLGRRQRAADNRAAVAAVRAAGFESFNLDLIQGVAGQTVATALADVEAVVALEPTHVSTYQLTISPATPFGARAARGEVLVAPEDDQAAIYEGTRAALAAAGIFPYEVSNAARPGFEAVHNTLYWTGGEYVGLGAGAHGFRRDGEEGERWENERHAGRYVEAALAGRPRETFRERIDAAARLEERVLTGLRLDRGLVVDAALEARFGAAARRLAAEGLLRTDGGRWRVTDRGRLLLDRVVVRLVAA